MVGDDPHGWWACLEGVPDPEIPVISIVELGVVRDIRQGEHGIDVDLSPTYTGCPAMDMMAEDVQKSLAEKTGQQVQVHLVIDPPWTTDWLSQSTKDKLRAYGIAPPVGSTSDKRELFGPPAQVSCPKCQSAQTERVSAFGSTACKSLYRCLDCQEPFDYFKCH